RQETAMASYLEKVELFAVLGTAQLETLAQGARLRTFQAGTIVVSEGDDAHGLFVVQSGALKCFLTDENARELTLSLLGPGEYFGELALIDEAPRSASVIASERSELLQISRTSFLALLDANPPCMKILLRN